MTYTVNMAEDGKSHVQVKFFTKQAQYAIPDTPHTVPADVDTEQLSALINGLLFDETEGSSVEGRHVQFDFLLDGEFVHTTLNKFLESREILAETLLEVEYVERQTAPRPEESLEHDDWVSAVQATRGHILSGSYDHTIRLWSTTGEAIMTIPGHSAAVKCVAWIQHDEGAGSAGS